MVHGCDSHHTMGYSETEDAKGAADERLRDEGRSQGRHTNGLNFPVFQSVFRQFRGYIFCLRKNNNKKVAASRNKCF